MAPLPSFYDADRIGTLFYPDVQRIAADAAAAGLAPAVEDLRNVHLVLIDMQIDFCHSGGSLNVPGALGDIQRLIEFIYRHAQVLTNITCSLDAHLPFQIFHPAWWTDRDGKHPAPFTMISYEDIREGHWRPLVAPTTSVKYVRALEQQAKKTLTIWPYHVGIGGIGNALDPELWSAIIWHSLARKSQPTWLTKGSVPQTEHYSIIQPEITVPGHPLGGNNKVFLDTLEAADTIIIAGEAESHCVLETVEDLVEAFSNRPDLLDKIYFLQDCTSPVVHPAVDFHAIAMTQFHEFTRLGIHLVNSTDQLPFLQPAANWQRPVAVV